MSSIIETILRSGLGFVLLLAFTRMIGNKQLGQLNVFTYISGIAVGAMAGAMAILHDIEVIESVVGIVVWAVLTVLFEKTTLGSLRLRNALTGDPVMIIKKGVVQRQAMKKERLDLDDLLMLLRTNDVFSISDVQYAILESNGELSVLKKAAQDIPTRQELAIDCTEPPCLPTIVISDGKVIHQALKELGRDPAWLQQALLAQGIRDAGGVFYAEIGADGSLTAQPR